MAYTNVTSLSNPMLMWHYSSRITHPPFSGVAVVLKLLMEDTEPGSEIDSEKMVSQLGNPGRHRFFCCGVPQSRNQH
jgi:hypothetical protein